MNDRKHRARERTIKQSFGRKQLRAISLTTLGIWISHILSRRNEVRWEKESEGIGHEHLAEGEVGDAVVVFGL